MSSHCTQIYFIILITSLVDCLHTKYISSSKSRWSKKTPLTSSFVSPNILLKTPVTYILNSIKRYHVSNALILQVNLTVHCNYSDSKANTLFKRLYRRTGKLQLLHNFRAHTPLFTVRLKHRPRHFAHTPVTWHTD